MYIKKIRFKVEDFGLGTIDMKRRYVYEIYPDGRWIEYTYQGESNRYTYKDICVTKKENVLRLYNKYQKLFEAQMNAWALMFSSGLLTDKPTIISNDSASALYNTLKPK